MAGNLVEPAFECSGIPQARLLTVCAKERFLREVFGFRSIPNKIAYVPRYCGAALLHFRCNLRGLWHGVRPKSQ